MRRPEFRERTTHLRSLRRIVLREDRLLYGDSSAKVDSRHAATRALAGEISRDDLRWPGPDADESVLTAFTAADEYLDVRSRGLDEDDEDAYWAEELGRMIERLEVGEPLEHEQLAGWKGIDLTSCFRMPLNASTRTQRRSGAGSGSFLRSVVGRTGRPGERVGTTSTRRWCSEPFDRPSARPASPSTFREPSRRLRGDA